MTEQTRDGRGRYEHGPKCEACGRPAGFDYYSCSNPDATGHMLVLCDRDDCPSCPLCREEEGP